MDQSKRRPGRDLEVPITRSGRYLYELLDDASLADIEVKSDGVLKPSYLSALVRGEIRFPGADKALALKTFLGFNLNEWKRLLARDDKDTSPHVSVKEFYEDLGARLVETEAIVLIAISGRAVLGSDRHLLTELSNITPPKLNLVFVYEEQEGFDQDRDALELLSAMLSQNSVAWTCLRKQSVRTPGTWLGGSVYVVVPPDGWTFNKEFDTNTLSNQTMDPKRLERIDTLKKQPSEVLRYESAGPLRGHYYRTTPRFVVNGYEYDDPDQILIRHAQFYEQFFKENQ